MLRPCRVLLAFHTLERLQATSSAFRFPARFFTGLLKESSNCERSLKTTYEWRRYSKTPKTTTSTKLQVSRAGNVDFCLEVFLLANEYNIPTLSKELEKLAIDVRDEVCMLGIPILYSRDRGQSRRTQRHQEILVVDHYSSQRNEVVLDANIYMERPYPSRSIYRPNDFSEWSMRFALRICLPSVLSVKPSMLHRLLIQA